MQIYTTNFDYRLFLYKYDTPYFKPTDFEGFECAQVLSDVCLSLMFLCSYVKKNRGVM